MGAVYFYDFWVNYFLLPQDHHIIYVGQNILVLYQQGMIMKGCGY